MDAERYREESRLRWERAARGWSARREQLQAMAMPVSRWMIDAIRPQPGQTLLELAAGPGDTGLLAAELIAPGGTLISTDGAEPMVEVARRRAAELGVENVEFRAMDAEWLDLETASVDGVLCRWGYMLLADPAAALRETRRVLRPGGRVALAAWDAAERNQWAAVPARELVARGLAPAPEPDAPSMFAFAQPGRIEQLLADAGFSEPAVEALDLEARYDDFEHWWETTLDLAMPFADAVAQLSEQDREALRASLREQLEAHATGSDGLVIPARTLVAAATA